MKFRHEGDPELFSNVLKHFCNMTASAFTTSSPGLHLVVTTKNHYGNFSATVSMFGSIVLRKVRDSKIAFVRHKPLGPGWDRAEKIGKTQVLKGFLEDMYKLSNCIQLPAMLGAQVHVSAG